MYEYVGFWKRVVARIIDGCILAVPTNILYFLLSLPIAARAAVDPYADSIALSFYSIIIAAIMLLFSTAAYMLYYILLWKTRQATVGYMIFGAKLIDANTGGTPTTGQCVGRYFAEFLSALVFCLGYLWVAFDPQKRGWHDMLAGTLVVKPVQQ
jgi:uncharacterized RDD family membrane protein YckC